MSYEINPEEVRNILLADGWHRVSHETFSVDTLSFVGGDGATSSFEFKDADTREWVHGPLTSMLAFKTGKSND
jgi:hypothetical protein